MLKYYIITLSCHCVALPVDSRSAQKKRDINHVFPFYETMRPTPRQAAKLQETKQICNVTESPVAAQEPQSANTELHSSSDLSCHDKQKSHICFKRNPNTRIPHAKLSPTCSSCAFSLFPIKPFPEYGRALAAASPLSDRGANSPRAVQALSPLCSSCRQLLYWLGGSADSQADTSAFKLTGLVLG